MCCVRQLGNRRYAYENGLKGRFPSCLTQRMQRTLVIPHRSKKPNARTRKTQRTQRTELIACVVFFFACMRCVFRFLIASKVVRSFHCVCCVACVEYDNLETVCRPTKTDLKVGFQAAVCNATDGTHAGHATQIFKNRNAHTRKMQRTHG